MSGEGRLDACLVAPHVFMLDDVCLQGPLLELSSRLCDYANSGGIIILSGFLDEQWPTIREAYEREFENFQVCQDGQWVAITGIKRDNQPSAVNPSLQSNVDA